MIKKLRNQPYAPKWEQAPKCGARGGEKNMLYAVYNRASKIQN
jgi:hypothetical protein